MNFGISTACFYPALLEDAIEHLGQQGVKQIEIFANTYTETRDPYLSQMIERLRAYDMSVTSVHPFSCAFEPFLFFTPYERRYQDGLEQYKPLFEMAARVGAPYLVFHGNSNHSTYPSEAYYERFAGLRAVGKTFGVRLAQENVAPYHSHKPAFLKGLREYLADDVDFVLDIKQAVRVQTPVEEFLDAMGDRICHLHLSDHTEIADCLPIGQGEFDFQQLFKTLKQKQFDGTGVVELYRSNYGDYDELYQSMVQLQEIWQCAE